MQIFKAKLTLVFLKTLAPVRCSLRAKKAFRKEILELEQPAKFRSQREKRQAQETVVQTTTKELNNVTIERKQWEDTHVLLQNV